VNAPDPITAFRSLALDAIALSDTPMQRARRARFDPAALERMTESVRSVGVLEPILVRPRGDVRGPAYELVAGERRYLAAKAAGLDHVPTTIRDLSDLQVIEVQLIENLQREDVGALEEALGYQQLMQSHDYTAEDIAARIGKSRSYVYTRTQLLRLDEQAREALETGAIDASKALLLARIRAPKIQKKALQLLLDNAGHYSHRELLRRLREKFMLPLADAPFDLGDGGLLPEAGPCTACPHNSANDPELQADLDASVSRYGGFDAGAHACTDVDCHARKLKAHTTRLVARAQQGEITLLRGDDAKKVFPTTWETVGYVALDAECEEALPPEPEETGDDAKDQAAWDAWAEQKPPTYRELIAGEVPTVLVEHPTKGTLIEMVPAREAQRVLKAKGIEIDVQLEPRSNAKDPVKDWAEENRKRQEREQAEREWRAAVMREIHARWKGPVTRDDLLLIAEHVSHDWGARELWAVCYGGKPPQFADLDDVALTRLILELTVARGLDPTSGPKPLTDFATRLKIDCQKLKKQLQAERKEAAKPKAAKAVGKGKTEKGTKA
jgi:ParB/RepB/Spo0J family partition protein